jgi:hypothetical protein
MKRLLSILLLTLSASAMAQHHGYHGGHWRHHPSYGWGWTVPVIVGGAIIGYEISKSNQPPVVVQQQPVIVQNQPAPVFQNCSPWTETQNPDGTITRSRTCSQ